MALRYVSFSVLAPSRSMSWAWSQTIHDSADSTPLPVYPAASSLPRTRSYWSPNRRHQVVDAAVAVGVVRDVQVERIDRIRQPAVGVHQVVAHGLAASARRARKSVYWPPPWICSSSGTFPPTADLGKPYTAASRAVTPL